MQQHCRTEMTRISLKSFNKRKAKAVQIMLSGEKKYVALKYLSAEHAI